MCQSRPRVGNRKPQHCSHAWLSSPRWDGGTRPHGEGEAARGLAVNPGSGRGSGFGEEWGRFGCSTGWDGGFAGTVALLAAGRSGWCQARRGTARFWEAAAHQGSSYKTCRRLLAGPCAPAWCMVPFHPPSSRLRLPSPACQRAVVWPGMWMRNPLALFFPLPRPFRQLLRAGSSRLAHHGEPASGTSLRHLVPVPREAAGWRGRVRDGAGEDGWDGEVMHGKARLRSSSQRGSFQHQNIPVPVPLCPFPP